MRMFRRGLAAACFAVASLAPVAQAETTLKFATALASESELMKQVYRPWMEALNEKAKGQFRLQAFPPPFATAVNVWERTLEGVAEIGLVVLPPTGIPFNGPHVTTVPGTGSDVRAGALAMWDLYEQGLFGDDFKDVKVLSFTTVPVNVLVSKRELKSLEEVKGLKARANDKNSAAALEALGMAPIAIPFSEAYQAFSNGVVQAGVANGVTIVGFRFYEVTGYQVDNVFFGMVPAALVMNKAAYERLSPEAKAILESVTGRQASLEVGRLQYAYDQYNRSVLDANPNYHFVALPPEEKAKWDAALATVGDTWAKATPNGEAILKAYRAAYAKAEGEL